MIPTKMDELRTYTTHITKELIELNSSKETTRT
jgi:hypothetical protein